MYKRLDEKIFFLDIETVSKYQSYDELTESEKKFWEAKSKYQRKNGETAEAFYGHAAIWAEFGKIICISIGYIVNVEGKRQFRITSLHGEEKNILLSFKHIVEPTLTSKECILCAHNGKEFDFPYIARRMLINSITLPNTLELHGKKPWEVKHIDTMEMWRFGDYKNYTSLDLIANILGIPSPKETISGADINNVYYIEGDIDKIVSYCERDTLTVAQIYLKFLNQELLKENEIFKI